MSDKNKRQFNFEISLSVLNHLGRHLYRSFSTVLGEAISNSWDADADNVWIYIDRKKANFFIKDDGIGMTADDFQHKFLKIGYSKRGAGKDSSDKDRPFHGRKGIGKLALLSCAKRIHVISKVKGGNYVGGVIDNSQLDKAITEDLTPQHYPLGPVDPAVFGKHLENHENGTIIYFENIHEGIRSSFDFLKKTIALYFRFSLLDKAFKMFLNDDQITHEHLGDLVNKTQFLWRVGELDDPLIKALETAFSKESNEHEAGTLKIPRAAGFIASVRKPRDLKIVTTDERVGVDLFVNGRLREKDILKHVPTARLVENYLYGQIHFDSLDDKVDRFTSSREAIVADDPKYKAFLDNFKKALADIVEDWDKWRIKHRDTGDEENPRITPQKRASLGLYGAVSKGFTLPVGKNRDLIDGWVDELGNDAAFNFESYAECFISENLVRKFIEEKKIELSPEAKAAADKWKKNEAESKGKGNISIEIRRVKSDLTYLDMDNLANLVDKPTDPNKEAALARDAKEYKPIRDAVAHTALLTVPAKNKLSTVRENIKGRVKTLLSE